MSCWEILNVFWDVILQVSKLISAEIWSISLNYYYMKWQKVSLTRGSFQQQWLYDWHCSTEYSEHTLQGNAHNQHFAHSEIYIIAKFPPWGNLFDEDGRGFICSLESTLIWKHERLMIANDDKKGFILYIFIKWSTCDQHKQGVKSREHHVID